ncbi:MAG: family 78 glycoside hydrolase catalytic domain, partial [Thermoguttaceae bacterium]
MNNRQRILPILAVAFVAAFLHADGSQSARGADEAGALKVERLRCEYLADPLGIDETAPRLSWIVTSDQRGQRQTAYRILVAGSEESLVADRGDLWDSGRVESGETVNVVYAGRALASRQKCCWKVMSWDGAGKPSGWSEPGRWSMGLLAPSDWKAQWISFRDESPLDASQKKVVLPPARYYRKPVEMAKPVRRATVYASALGIYELSINGRRVGTRMFAPGWCDYAKRCFYNTFDVTEMVRTGENVLGAIVADGWYAGYVGYGLLVGYGPNRCGRFMYGKTPALMVQLEIEYADGSRETVATDGSWKVATGPIVEADMLMGEAYDARLELPGWDAAGFDDSAWAGAIRAEDNGSLKAEFVDQSGPREVELGFRKPPRMQAHPGAPIEPIEEIRPLEITEPAPGVHIFNLGQNFSGVVRLKVQGPAGTKVQIRHGEMLHPDGRLMTENLRKARATDTYTLRGDLAGEVWTPRFTYHGFQFVELTGYPGKPQLDAVTGVVIHSRTALASSFECSDEMVNRLFRNVVWTQRANFFEIPTDCPQRDERLGWTGDAQIYVRTATLNADVAAFFTKWLQDLEEAQLADGPYPDYAPYPMQHGKPHRAFATAWMDAGVICPYTIYRAYGDTRVLERHWDSMERFMEFRRRSSPDFLGVAVGNDWGDWLSLNETTPVEYVDTIYFAYTSRLMAEMADALGKKDAAGKYRQWFDGIVEAYAKKYIDAQGRLTVQTQSAHALALYAGLVPERLRQPFADRLAEMIRQNDVRMATGFLGTKHLLPVLSAWGHNDLAGRLLQSRRFPSWGYEIDNGATTIWERWNSFTKDEGFMAGMNSFSHYSFGAVCEWMFTNLAGIDQREPGFGEVVIRPMPQTGGSNPEHPAIDWVRARYDSIRGPIACDWRLVPDGLQLDVTIPANATALVSMPAEGV